MTEQEKRQLEFDIKELIKFGKFDRMTNIIMVIMGAIVGIALIILLLGEIIL